MYYYYNSILSPYAAIFGRVRGFAQQWLSGQSPHLCRELGLNPLVVFAWNWSFPSSWSRLSFLSISQAPVGGVLRVFPRDRPDRSRKYHHLHSLSKYLWRLYVTVTGHGCQVKSSSVGSWMPSEILVFDGCGTPLKFPWVSPVLTCLPYNGNGSTPHGRTYALSRGDVFVA